MPSFTAGHVGYELTSEINVVNREVGEKHSDYRGIVLMFGRWSTEVGVTFAPNSPQQPLVSYALFRCPSPVGFEPARIIE
jgi:hypothetical protein